MTIDARGGVDRMEKNECRTVFNLYLEMHNCIKYYNWFLTIGYLIDILLMYFIYVKLCVILYNYIRYLRETHSKTQQNREKRIK